MCLAIYKPKGATLDRDELKTGFSVNPHGAGFAWSNPRKKQLNVLKGFFDFDSFWTAFEHHKEFPCIVHFRWATHGAKGTENCHPWPITSNLAMIHNGIIDIETDGGVLSDTGVFANTVLQPLLKSNPDLWRSDHFTKLVSMAVGPSNKLCFLDSAGHHLIVNEEQGLWEKGAWFSNTSHKKPTRHWLSDDCFPDWKPSRDGRLEELEEQTDESYWRAMGCDAELARKHAADVRGDIASELEMAEFFRGNSKRSTR